jgi:hypothetical protein
VPQLVARGGFLLHILVLDALRAKTTLLVPMIAEVLAPLIHGPV